LSRASSIMGVVVTSTEGLAGNLSGAW